MRVQILRAAVIAAVLACLTVAPVSAQNTTIQDMRNELRQMRQAYESRISALESKLQKVASQNTETQKKSRTASSSRTVHDNSFNPSIGVILNGKISSFSANSSEFSGFAVGEEGERGRKGLAIDESEFNFSANVDDKFHTSSTVAIVREDGTDNVELEEAYVQTLPGAGLPNGARIKMGRAFWTFGYLNEHHTHADDFMDRPLPYRAFLNKAFNDDGIELSWVLPTNFFTEIGGGLFRGDDFPFGGSSGGAAAWSAFARVGGDIGANQSWRLGAYMLDGSTNGRKSNEDTVTFIGDTRIYATDLRYTWAPTGNNRNAEVTMQAEYLHRSEKGTYEDTGAGSGLVGFDDSASGWYLQSVYKFHPNWRVGMRYSRLEAPDVPTGLANSVLDSGGHNPEAIALMTDWSNSEFSRLRLQYNYEALSAGNDDHQLMLQYVMSIGAHGAHAF
jgi:hypothetical protein